jgi:hypothetical protein
VIQQPEYSTDDGTTWTGYDWSCRIDGAHNDDPTVTLTVDGGAAATDILDGMTVLIGSSKYGDWDKGIYRVRGDQTVDGATVALDIGTSSEVRGNVEDDDYVVVLDEFRFWQRYGRIEIVADEPVWYKDYDITWADLGGTDAARRLAMMPPVPVMGPHAVKFVEIGGTASTFYYDWQDSYAPAVGETVATWTSEGEQDHAGTTWNSAAETPGWQTTDTISGLRGFRVTLEVDDGNGNATTLPYRRGVRYVFTLRRPGETQVGDPANSEPITEFEMAEPASGDFEQGYWRTSITVYESAAAQYNIMPGALVILFTEDVYGTTSGSLGPITDRENILLVGRIVDGTIRKNPETGDVTFDVASPGAEAAMYHNYPIVIQNDDGATTWIDTPDLTVDRAVHYYTTWHTTLNLIADLYQIGSTTEIFAQDFLEGDIYSTLNQFMNDRLFARLLCDKYGRFHCEVDANEQAFGGTTVQWTMQTADWLEEVTVRHRTPYPVNASECGGIIYSGGVITPKLSHAPGLFTLYRGSQDASTALAIVDQDTLNTTCGRHLAALNHEFEIDFQLAGNWRYCDIAPQRVVDVGTLVTDRESLTGNYIIRSVTNTYLPGEGAIFTEIQTEQEADDGVAGVTIVIPEELPSRTPTTRIPRLPVNPGGPGGGSTVVDLGRRIISTNVGVYATDNIGATNPVWYSVNTGLPADTTRRCWKIFRDPWHWWTSGGTERTLWGIFSDPTDSNRPRYVYKMEDFPYGTWTEMMDAADFAFAPLHSGLYWVCDLVATIEVEDLLYATIQHPTAGLTSSPGWLVNSANGGAAWNDLGQFTAVNTDGFPPWPGSTMTIDTGKHSAAQSVYVYQSFMIPGTDFAVRVTTNGGGAWATLTPNIGPWGADIDGQMFVPYHAASWGDTDLIVRTRNIANDAKGLQRSTDSGATWSNIGEATAGYSYRAGSGYTMNRLIYAALYGSVAATTIKYTVDAGANWTNWATTAYPVGYAALFEFDTAGILSSVLLTDITGGLTPFAVHLVSLAQDQDKTGNLLTVAAGINTITRFERDTMGGA